MNKIYYNNFYILENEKWYSIYSDKFYKRWEQLFIIEWIITSKPTTFTIPIDKNLYIDPYEVDSLWKYLCHSCNPNAWIKWRNIIIAFKDINVWDEITIDYSMIVYDFYDNAPWSNIICKCWSNNCRWKFIWYKLLSYEEKIKYNWYISEYLLT